MDEHYIRVLRYQLEDVTNKIAELERIKSEIQDKLNKETNV